MSKLAMRSNSINVTGSRPPNKLNPINSSTLAYNDNIDNKAT